MEFMGVFPADPSAHHLFPQNLQMVHGLDSLVHHRCYRLKRIYLRRNLPFDHVEHFHMGGKDSLVASKDLYVEQNWTEGQPQLELRLKRNRSIDRVRKFCVGLPQSH